MVKHGNDILLEKRPSGGGWGGLWCPPQFKDEVTAKAWFEQNNLLANGGQRLQTFSHTFSHFKLLITPLHIQLKRKPKLDLKTGSVWLDREAALQAAIPTPVRKILAEIN